MVFDGLARFYIMRLTPHSGVPKLKRDFLRHWQSKRCLFVKIGLLDEARTFDMSYNIEFEHGTSTFIYLNIRFYLLGVCRYCKIYKNNTLNAYWLDGPVVSYRLFVQSVVELIPISQSY